MSNNDAMIAQLKEQAFAAAKIVKIGGYTASELGTKHMLLGGNGNYFSNEVLKPFVDALFTGDTAAIGSAMQLLTEQTRNIMGAHKDPDRGIVLFGQLSKEEQKATSIIASRYVEQVERVVKTYIARMPGTGVAIISSK